MKKKGLLALILTLCALFSCMGLVACNDGDNPPDEPPVTKSITLTQTQVTSSVLDDVILEATTENITEAIVWTSSDQAVATVSDGVVTAKKAGTVTITVSAEGESDSAEVTFTTVSGLKAKCDFSNVAIRVGQTSALNAWATIDGINEIEGAEFTYTPADATIVSVNNGVVEGLAKGQTTITIGGTIKGIALETTTITVVVSDSYALSTGATNDEVTIYSYEGREGDKATTYTLAPELKVNGEVDATATFSYVLEGDACTLDATTGVVTAVKSGAVKVIISYVTEEQKTISQELFITVEKPVYETDSDDQIVIGVYNGFTFESLGITDTVESITANDKSVVYEVVNGKVMVSEGLSSGKDIVLGFNTVKEIIKVKVNVYDYMISDAATFTALKGIIAGDQLSFKDKVIAITKNIDLSGVAIENIANFAGTIDGLGHTLYNLNMPHRWIENSNGATLKNFAMVNVVRSERGGGVLVLDTANTTFENIYIQGVFTAVTDQGGLYNTGSTSTIKNVVLQIEFPNQQAIHGTIATTGSPLASDVYVVSKKSSGKLLAVGSDESRLTNCKLYQSASEMSAEVDTIKETFNSEYWTVEKGVLIFKSATAIVDQIFAGVNSISITNTETRLVQGTGITLTASVTDGVTYSIKTPVNGVSIEGAMLSAGDVDNGEVTVVATWSHPVYNVVVTAEKTFEVKEAQNVKLDKVDYPIEKGAFTYDLTAQQLSNVESISIDQQVISGWSFRNNLLTIPSNKFTGGNQEITIYGESNSTICIVAIPVYTINYLIETVEEFKAIGSLVDSTGLYGKVIALGANLDLNGETIYQFASEFNGTFDGRGYAISNFTLHSRLFTYSRCGTFKNLAIVNVKNLGGYGGLFFADQYSEVNAYTKNIVIENVFIHVSSFINSATTGIIARDYLVGTMSNVVIVIDGAVSNSAQGVIAPSAGSYPTLNNVYVVSSNATKLLGTSADNAGIYASQSALNEVVAGFAVTETAIGTFGKDLWTVENGSLVMKSALVEEVVNITNADTKLYSDSSITLTANKEVVWSLENAVEGITISGNVITATSSVKASTVTVVATHTKTVAGVNIVTTDKITFEVISITTVNKATAVYGANRTSGAFTYDLSEYNMTDISVTLDGAQFTAYTFVDGILTIERANLSNGLRNLKVEGDNYLINIPVEVADWAIGTADELTAWGAVLTQHTGEGKVGKFNGRAILTAHIDYNNQDWQAKSGGTRYMSGEFDGRGYTISNLKTIGSPVFYSLDQGDLKNVAFENLYVEYTHCMIAHRANNAAYKNIYVQGVWNQPSRPSGANTGSFGWATYPPAGDVNVVMIVEKQYQGQPDTAASENNVYYFVGHGGHQCSNIFVEMQYSNGIASTNAAISTLYTTAGSLNADATNIVEKLNNPYWKVVDGAVKLVPIA